LPWGYCKKKEGGDGKIPQSKEIEIAKSGYNASIVHEPESDQENEKERKKKESCYFNLAEPQSLRKKEKDRERKKKGLGKSATSEGHLELMNVSPMTPKHNV
jgi:hypothetical protein